MSTVLVTGGAGFIGSHTSVELLNAGYDIIILDNFVNSKPESLKRIKELTGKDFKFYQADIRDEEAMTKVFAENKIDAVIHFAGLKSVPQSVKEPLNYYDNNIAGTVCLCRVMDKAGCKKLVFSSSATVYGVPHFRHCLRQQEPLSAQRGYADRRHHEPLRHDEVFHRADTSGSVHFRQRVGRVHPPLLQSHRRAQERAHRRGSQRNPRQPHALYHSGRHRQARVPQRLRQRLSDPGRHWRARLYPCCRSGSRPHKSPRQIAQSQGLRGL